MNEALTAPAWSKPPYREAIPWAMQHAVAQEEQEGQVMCEIARVMSLLRYVFVYTGMLPALLEEAGEPG